MKMPGIVGEIGPESTIEYYQFILDGCRAPDAGDADAEAIPGRGRGQKSDVRSVKSEALQNCCLTISGTEWCLGYESSPDRALWRRRGDGTCGGGTAQAGRGTSVGEGKSGG